MLLGQSLDKQTRQTQTMVEKGECEEKLQELREKREEAPEG